MSEDTPGSKRPNPCETLHGVRSPRAPATLPPSTDPLVRAAVDLFLTRPRERWSVQGLARELGTSRPVLNRRFVEAQGKPPLRVLREIRMSRAAELLSRSDDGLAAIAYAVGYDSEFALSRAFFRHFGIRPGAFRRARSHETTTCTLRSAA